MRSGDGAFLCRKGKDERKKTKKGSKGGAEGIVVFQVVAFQEEKQKRDKI